jgi:tRNA (cytidine32/uridine32-2'-O)-methyltransferase
VALVFGREAHGLKNEELQKCHFHVNIPTGKAYSSLNLAMAVQILCYEVLQAHIEHLKSGSKKQVEQPWDMEYATTDAVEKFFIHLEETLIEVEFHDPENPRQLMTRLRRMFNRIRPDQMEVNMLRGFMTSIQNKISSK